MGNLNNLTIEELWADYKNSFTESADEVVGTKQYETKEWMSKETWDKIEERRIK